MLLVAVFLIIEIFQMKLLKNMEKIKKNKVLKVFLVGSTNIFDIHTTYR